MPVVSSLSSSARCRRTASSGSRTEGRADGPDHGSPDAPARTGARHGVDCRAARSRGRTRAARGAVAASPPDRGRAPARSRPADGRGVRGERGGGARRARAGRGGAVADLTDAQRKRAEARQRRRSQDDVSDEPEASSDGDGDEPHPAVKQPAKGAGAVGAAGAAAAAARALTSHGEHEEEDAPEPREPPEQEQEQKPQDAQDDQQEATQEPEQEQSDEPVAGAGPSDARKVIDRAREQLQDLLERPVESVSSLERTHDGWVAQLEVVELKRIPESTDVLATYEMELDADLNLRRYQQAGRYTRSRANRSEGS